VLTHLVDKSLVLVDDSGEEPRYRLLETVRQYATEELDREGETESARDRHLQRFYEQVLAATNLGEALYWAPPPEWMRRLVPEADNLLEAMAWAGTAPAWEGGGLTRVGRGMRIGDRLQHFWVGRGLAQPARHALLRLLARESEAESDPAASAWYVSGSLAGHLGETQEARALVERALQRSREQGFPDTVRRCLQGSGTLHLWAGNLAEAQACFEEALSIARELGEPHRIAGNLQNIATVTRDEERAETLTQEALELFRSVNDAIGVASCSFNLGVYHSRRREFRSARDHFEEAVRSAQLSSNLAMLAGAIGGAALCESKLGNPSGARARFSQALALAVEKFHFRLVDIIDGIGCCAADSGEPTLALRLWADLNRLRPHLASFRSRNGASTMRRRTSPAALSGRQRVRTKPLSARRPRVAT
jgi:tetratricopeptide (TPR) repeat protein